MVSSVIVVANCSLTVMIVVAPVCGYWCISTCSDSYALHQPGLRNLLAQ